MTELLARVPLFFLVFGVFVVVASVRAEPSAGEDDALIVHDAGLSSDGPALLAFFQARARMDVDGEQLRQLIMRFAADGTSVACGYG